MSDVGWDFETVRNDLPYYDGPIGDAWDALDRIEADRKFWLEKVDQLADRVRKQEAEVERLRAALERIANMSKGYGDFEDCAVIARAALAKEEWPVMSDFEKVRKVLPPSLSYEADDALDRIEAELAQADNPADDSHTRAYENGLRVGKEDRAKLKESATKWFAAHQKLTDIVAERNAEVKSLLETCGHLSDQANAAEAEVERLQVENSELRKAFESDEYAIEQAREVERLRAGLDQKNQHEAALNNTISRLREEVLMQEGAVAEVERLQAGLNQKNQHEAALNNTIARLREDLNEALAALEQIANPDLMQLGWGQKSIDIARAALAEEDK
jgi:antitoxin component HigA of HigAB toxin-antitoxin module